MSFPTEASVLSALCYLALAQLSTADRPSGGATEFGELGRVAYLRNDPRIRSKIGRWLFLDASADWRRPKGDRMTSLCHRDVVLAPVLAHEKTFFPVEKACQVQTAYRYVDFEFYLQCFLSFVEANARAVIDDRQVT